MFKQQGFTFIEVLVIMVLLTIITGFGVSYTFRAIDSVKVGATVNEMRNIAYSLDVFKKRGTDTIINFSISGTIAELNLSQATTAIMILPPTNKFDYAYHYSLTPTIRVSTNVPVANINPFGANDIESATNATTITVYYRSKVANVKNYRLNWVRRFFYENDDLQDLVNRQRNLANFASPTVITYDVNAR